MRKYFRHLLQKVLKIESKSILKKYQPKIIGITGSVGKTSAKEAITTVLSKKFLVRQTIGNYNNEIGVPLTIIGEKTAGQNIFGWLRILLKGLGLILFMKDYPEILVLELGIDKPKDMDYLLDFIKPYIGVITAISEIPVHLEFFKNPEELAQEKSKLVLSLSSEDVAILNYDDKRVRRIKSKIRADYLTFGFDSQADIWADNVTINSKELSELNGQNPKGISYKLHYRENIIPVRMPYIFSKHQIYASLAAVAVGITFDLNLVEISQRLLEFRPPKGRMHLIKGIKNSFIIDDTYNASPDSTIAALDVLKNLSVSGKKIAVLGDMLELGVLTEKGHREVGKKAVSSCNVLVTVGSRMKFAADQAEKQGMVSENVFWFSEKETERAGKFIQNKILKEGDLVLIKGSRKMRMERIVKELMAEPLRADELLYQE